MKRTPLYEIHCEMGGRIIDFGGWALPVQYSGILEEHEAVRNAAGLFDVSHMGEIIIKGEGAASFVQRMVTNDLSVANEYQIVYSPMCYPDGGVVDDLLIYRMKDDEYLLVVNASNTDKDFEWMQKNAEGSVEIFNVSSQYAQLAIQGPKAEEILQKLIDIPLKEIKFFHYGKGRIDGAQVLVSRTGYTGEDGFEIYAGTGDARLIWMGLLEEGSSKGLKPAGLGARDTLRFEAALPLYGQEISPDISPLEARLEKFVKLEKEDFIGKAALISQKEKGIRRKLAGFEMVDRGIPRSHYDIQVEGRSIGFVTSGSFSPTLKKNLGIAVVDRNYSAEGTEFDVVIRNNMLKARVVKLPFYNKRYKK